MRFGRTLPFAAVAVVAVTVFFVSFAGSENVVRSTAHPYAPCKFFDYIGGMKKRKAYDYSLRRLLLVAGVSGSGKSTLISELTRRRLAPEILSAPPEDAWNWHIVDSKEPNWLRRLFRRHPEKKSCGQILHYDMTYMYNPKRIDGVLEPAPRLYSVDDDENLKRKLAAADEIHVLIIRTPRSQLIQQLSARSILIHVPKFARSKASRYVAHMQRLESALPNWVTDKTSRMLGSRWRHRSNIRERHARLLELYAEEGALDSIYRHWEASLANECGGRLKEPVHYVEPTLGPQNGKAFRLLAARDSI